ncbi:hypothetical protein F2Q69_00001486 [Brassica cretica]|uniref:Uncharacterized protein n=1 Tax=Brassica cretica TaxID=69181 RepID=A0A8S9NUJ6_BRACR|nr:hypothetical protein F2Q69_00001486 [Brassica cretica]
MKISIGLKNFKIWNYNKSGEYSSNSGYWFASQHLKSESRLEAERLPSITSLKELSIACSRRDQEEEYESGYQMSNLWSRTRISKAECPLARQAWAVANVLSQCDILVCGISWQGIA